MNTNPFGSQVYNATPTVSSANGISILDIGVSTVSMGLPIDSQFISTNYIARVLSSVNYINNHFTNTNYIKPSVLNTNYVKG